MERRWREGSEERLRLELTAGSSSHRSAVAAPPADQRRPRHRQRGREAFQEESSALAAEPWRAGFILSRRRITSAAIGSEEEKEKNTDRQTKKKMDKDARVGNRGKGATFEAKGGILGRKEERRSANRVDGVEGLVLQKRVAVCSS